MRGLEFNTHSNSTTAFKSSSYVNLAFFKIFFRQRSTYRAMRSKKPHHGARSYFNFHFNLWFRRKLCTSRSSKMDDKNLAAVFQKYLGTVRHNQSFFCNFYNQSWYSAYANKTFETANERSCTQSRYNIKVNISTSTTSTSI